VNKFAIQAKLQQQIVLHGNVAITTCKTILWVAPTKSAPMIAIVLTMGTIAPMAFSVKVAPTKGTCVKKVTTALQMEYVNMIQIGTVQMILSVVAFNIALWKIPATLLRIRAKILA
jgi:hypothetical protein